MQCPWLIYRQIAELNDACLNANNDFVCLAKLISRNRPEAGFYWTSIYFMSMHPPLWVVALFRSWNSGNAQDHNVGLGRRFGEIFNWLNANLGVRIFFKIRTGSSPNFTSCLGALYSFHRRGGGSSSKHHLYPPLQDLGSLWISFQVIDVPGCLTGSDICVRKVNWK